MGKILDILQGRRTNVSANTGAHTPTSAPDAQGEAEGGAKESLRRFLSGLVPVALLAFGGAMAFAIWMLGQYYNQPETYRWLVAAGCTLGILGHGAAVTRPTTNTSRLWHGIALGTWVVLSLFLAALYMFRSSPDLRDVVPADMVFVGGVVYALTFAIGLVTSVVALVIPSVADRPARDTQHASIGGAVSKYAETAVILFSVAVSSFHLWQFGTKLGLDMFSTIMATVVADLAFVAAEKKVVSEVKARRESGRYDKFDLVLWGVFALVVLVYLILVNIYSVRLVSGAVDVSDGMFRLVRDFYAASPSVLLFSLAGLALVTAFVDKPAGTGAPQVVEGEARPVSSRIAGKIRGARSGAREIASAWRGEEERPQLPAPAPALAKDAPDNVPEFSAVERAAIQAALSDYVAKQKAHKKQAENGTGYDTTGTLVLMPEQDAELRAAGGGNEPGK